MSENRVVIFDFDGLILDTETVELNLWRKIFSEHDILFDLESYLKTIGSITSKTYEPSKILAEVVKNGETPSDIYRKVEKQIIDQLDGEIPLPGVLKTIQTAKSMGIKTAVGSSSTLDWVKAHLVRLGIWNQFDTVVTFEDVNECKPSPKIFLKVLERLDVQPHNAIVLEDSENGVLAARRAGIPVIVIPNEVTKNQVFTGAILKLSTLEDLDLKEFFSY